MSSRAGLRFLHTARVSWKQQLRRQTTDAVAAPAPSQQGIVSRMWNSPVGVKTVHFWAPVMKWGIVLAGISDFARPAEKLSLTQNLAITATGIIWTRWCFIIKPRNMLLAAVNFFLGCVGVTQLTRIFLWRQSQQGLEGTVKETVQETVDAAGEAAKKVEGKVKEVVQ